MIDREVVRHVARLARLRIEPDQEDRFVQEMERIVDYVDVLARLEVEDEAPIEPDRPTGLRDDVAVDFGRTDALRDGAPDRQGDLLRVPPVLADL